MNQLKSEDLLKTIAESFKLQQEIQRKTLEQFARLEKRDKDLYDLVKGIRTDLNKLNLENREQQHKSLKIQSHLLEVQRLALSELTNLPKGNYENRKKQEQNQRLEDKMMESNFTEYPQRKLDLHFGANQQSKQTSSKQALKRAQSRRENQTIDESSPRMVPRIQCDRNHIKQKEILIPFYEYKFISYYDYQKFKEKIAIWTGELYSELSQITYTRYSSKQFSKDEMKVFFTSNLILNSVQFMNFLIEKYPYLWKMHKKQILQEYDLQSKNTLKYLMRKYPMKKRGVIDYSLEQIIKTENNIYSPEFDSLKNSEICFEFNPQKQYCDKIKYLISVFTRMTMKNFKGFRKDMEKIFTITYMIPVQSTPVLENPNNNSYLAASKVGQQLSTSYLFPNTLQGQFSPRNTDTVNFNSTGFTNPPPSIKTDAFFKRQPTTLLNFKEPNNNTNSSYSRIVKNQIGMKFKENSPIYTMDEIKQKGMKIKSPEILRIIMKWIEVLQKTISVDLTDREHPFSNKYKQDKPVQLSTQEKQILKQKLKQSVLKMYSHREQALSELSNFIDKNRKQFNFIPENQAVVGLSTYILSDPVSKLTISYLQCLIHCILEAQTNFNLESKKKPISLLEFGVCDLLRARCSGSKQQIEMVYNNLKESKDFKIIRVKNRLDTVNRDFLINMKYKNTPLICELQLSIVNEKEEEQEKHKTINLFSHFLYELERSKYGPLTEAVITNNHLNSTIAFFQDEMKNVTINTLNVKPWYNKETKMIQIENYEILKIDISFTCNNCWKFKYTNESFLPSFQEVAYKGNRQNTKKICGICALERLPKEEKKAYLLEQISEVFEQVRMDEIKYLKRTNVSYLCIVNHGLKRNINILQKIESEQYNHILFLETFFTYNYPCLIYQLQDLNLAYAFKIKQSLPFTICYGNTLSEFSCIFSHPDINLKTIKAEEKFICYKLSNNKMLIMDKEYSNMENAEKISETNNLKKLIEYLKDDSNQNKSVKEKLKELNHSQIVSICGHRIISINFIDSKNIKILKVSQNSIKHIQFPKHNFDNLVEMDISSNALTQIHLNKNSLTKLRTLNASHNQISDLAISECKLSSLIHMSFENNHITDSAFAELRNITCLSELNMKSNRLKTVDFSIFKFGLLTDINLNFNEIVSIVGFSVLGKLQSLQMAINFLETLDLTNSHLKYLRKLDLTANRLKNILGLEELQSLKELYLSYNYLQKLDMSVLPDSKIEKVHISFNKLTTLTFDKTKIKNIKEFFAEKNRLKEFKQERSFSKISISFRLVDHRPAHEYSEFELMNMFNWVLNTLNKQNILNIIRELKILEGAREDQVETWTPQIEDPPFIRIHSIDLNSLRSIMASLMPEDNPVSSPSKQSYRATYQH